MNYTIISAGYDSRYYYLIPCFLGKCFLKYSPLKIAAVLLLLIMTACSSTSGPVVIRESSTPVLTKEGGSRADTDNQLARVQPVAPNRITAIPLVEKLIVQSNQKLVNKQYEQAINIAERGLRIDRKEPRLYLALSKAYKSEGNRQQSAYFARQGLRYAEKGDDVYKDLAVLSK